VHGARRRLELEDAVERDHTLDRRRRTPSSSARSPRASGSRSPSARRSGRAGPPAAGRCRRARPGSAWR
jgi:hypothetical protein